jgi:hypothetical protein
VMQNKLVQPDTGRSEEKACKESKREGGKK